MGPQSREETRAQLLGAPFFLRPQPCVLRAVFLSLSLQSVPVTSASFAHCLTGCYAFIVTPTYSPAPTLVLRAFACLVPKWIPGTQKGGQEGRMNGDYRPEHQPSSDTGPLLRRAHSYQRLDDAASHAHGGAVQAEGWGGCRAGRGSEPGEGQQSGGPPVGELGLLNLKRGAEGQVVVVWGSGALWTFACLGCNTSDFPQLAPGHLGHQ